MEQSNPNLSTDFVKDMLAESPAKEPKAVVADRIPKLPKNVHWAVKAVVEPYHSSPDFILHRFLRLQGAGKPGCILGLHDPVHLSYSDAGQDTFG